MPACTLSRNYEGKLFFMEIATMMVQQSLSHAISYENIPFHADCYPTDTNS
ncbi:hypothetical protein [Longicatena caecimuris]|uniref:hypothetical protein n=1 Tax=Longicatena caecimuris TaxID=1796635 RepID=UPI00031E71AC|nr:hypothetical protein [Longicatena caecimuris]